MWSFPIVGDKIVPLFSMAAVQLFNIKLVAITLIKIIFLNILTDIKESGTGHVVTNT